MQYRKRLIVASALLAGAAQAQVTLDGTLGRAGALSGPNYQITPDLGRQVGGNLFHSFGQFSIHTGESATFSGPNSVSNIIGRVTGGQMSFIDGTIRSTIPGANLYLLNPAGMLFGENARLDVNGAFHASTADYLQFSDDRRFDVRTPANSLLTVAPVAAFGFLGDAPAPITINGSFLQVPEGQTLSLIGGDISLSNATLYAPSGQINLASVGSAGEVVPSDTDLAMQGFGRLGEISVKRADATERVVVDEVELGDVDASGQGGGAIFIRGGQFVAQGRSLTQANTIGDQDGRGIHIAVDRLALTGGARITANTSGAGRGGDIHIAARDDATIDGAYFDAEAERLRPSGIIADALADSSQAGNITLATTRLSLTHGGAITSVAQENSRSGNLYITAAESINIDAINPGFVGNVDILGLSTAAARYAGDIQISTARLTLTSGGSINTFTWSDGEGRSGDITINASESVTVKGPQSGLFADAYGGGSMNAGDITVTTGHLSLTGGGQISSSTWGLGHGGDINITANQSITIIGEGYDAPSDIHFFSGVFSNSCGDCSVGNAGNITLTTRNLLIDAAGGGDSNGHIGIGTRADYTSGGNITVNADHLKLLNNAEISSSVAGNEFSDSGTVTINSTNLVALNGSKITAQATQGRGGNIQVNADVFLHDAANINDVLNASSQVIGNDGTVAINAPSAESISSLTALPTRYLNAADQIGHRCGASDPDTRSRLTVQGRGGLPPDPDQPATTRATGCSAESPTLINTAPLAAASMTQPSSATANFGDY